MGKGLSVFAQIYRDKGNSSKSPPPPSPAPPKTKLRLTHHRLSLTIAVSWLFLLLSVALVGVVWTPYNPNQAEVADQFQAPTWEHWLGTDGIGRDLLSMVMKGLGVSLMIASAVALLSIGLALIWSAGFTKFPDWLPFLDIWIAFPILVLAMALSVSLGASAWVIILACSFGFSISSARILIPKVRQIYSTDFMKNLRLMGGKPIYLAIRHVLPNLFPLLVLQISASFTGAILSEVGLTYLGLGVPNAWFSLGQVL
ncbi:MAG: ABC transporter permease, partial [Bifidobacteriaceae bacterium]|nr:ABC transporter permease [Bifidobacteriaceae bacterium]